MDASGRGEELLGRLHERILQKDTPDTGRWHSRASLVAGSGKGDLAGSSRNFPAALAEPKDVATMIAHLSSAHDTYATGDSFDVNVGLASAVTR